MATYRWDSAAGHVSHLRVGQPFEVVQDDHHPLGERQPRQCPGNRITSLIALRLRVRAADRIGDVLEEVEGADGAAAGYLVERPAGTIRYSQVENDEAAVKPASFSQPATRASWTTSCAS